MSRKKLIQGYALGQFLTEYPDMEYDEIISGMENNIEMVTDHVTVYEPFSTWDWSDIAEVIEEQYDVFSQFADELESL